MHVHTYYIRTYIRLYHFEISYLVSLCCVDGKGFRRERSEGAHNSSIGHNHDIEALHAWDRFYSSAYVAKVSGHPSIVILLCYVCTA